jgi:hypothetical protein
MFSHVEVRSTGCNMQIYVLDFGTMGSFTYFQLSLLPWKYLHPSFRYDGVLRRLVRSKEEVCVPYDSDTVYDAGHILRRYDRR